MGFARCLTALILIAALTGCSSGPKNGQLVSGTAETAKLSSISVFSSGDLFLTFDSTDQDSALWLASSPASFEALINWNSAGRLIWSTTRGKVIDLLVELSPDKNHRITLIRATCTDTKCGTRRQERGFRSGARFTMGEDGSSILMDDQSFVVYPTVTDLMRDTGTRTLRLTQPEQNELVVQSREATLVLTHPQDWSGELLEGQTHSRFRLAGETRGKPVALAMSEGLQFVVEDGGQSQLWDCPGAVLTGQGECTVYTAPKGFTHATSIVRSDCGIVVEGNGTVWLVREHAQTEELIAASGIVRCSDSEILSFLGRHIIYSTPERNPVTAQKVTLTGSVSS